MKNDVFLTLEKNDLKIHDELDFGDVPYFVKAYIETYFDVGKKFGLNLKDSDGVWVNLYARYNPCDNQFRVDYVIASDDSNVHRVYQPTQAETQVIQTLINEACIKETGHTCKDEFIRIAMEEADGINLVCEEVFEDELQYQIRNTYNDLVVYTEDENGKLKEHVGHSIEYVKYDTENGYSFSIECADCNEVILAESEPSEIVEDIEVEYLYGDYRIMIMPDYKKALNEGDVPPDLYCEVYSIKDTEFKNSLGDFNMMPGFEYTEYTVEGIEKAINKMMDESFSFYELQRREAEFNRADELLARSVGYIIELAGADGLKEVLMEKLDMTEDEADRMAESFAPEMEAEQGMTFG